MNYFSYASTRQSQEEEHSYRRVGLRPFKLDMLRDNGWGVAIFLKLRTLIDLAIEPFVLSPSVVDSLKSGRRTQLSSSIRQLLDNFLEYYYSSTSLSISR